MKRSRHMSAEPPSWSPDPASGTVLAEYLQHASPQFVAAELDKLGLLDAADEAAEAMHGRVAAPRAAPADFPPGRVVAARGAAHHHAVALIVQDGVVAAKAAEA